MGGGGSRVAATVIVFVCHSASSFVVRLRRYCRRSHQGGLFQCIDERRLCVRAKGCRSRRRAYEDSSLGRERQPERCEVARGQDVNEAACYYAARNADTSGSDDYLSGCLPILFDRYFKAPGRKRLRPALYVSTSAVLPRSNKSVAISKCPQRRSIFRRP